MAEAPPPAAGNHARRALTKKALSLSVDSKKFLLVDCARLNAFRNEFKNCRIFLLGVPPPLSAVFGGDRYQPSFMRTCVREREEGLRGGKRKKKEQREKQTKW